MSATSAGNSANSGDTHSWVRRKIGNLSVTMELGRGACATVLLAREDPSGRQVAIKVLSDEFSRNERQVQSFIEEARRAVKLRHPNILRVFSVAFFENKYFMVMEYSSQGTVQDLLEREGKLPLEHAVRVVRQAAEGLAFAEALGIVHRDIKPGNLLIAGDGTIKVCDMGIAGLTGEQAEDGDSIYGSPHYMAPEQAMGKAASSQSDIYSLGVTFYQVLTGRTPFKDTGRRSLILKHLHEEPVPVNRIVPILPKRVAEVVGFMMAKKPEERYQTFAQVLAELKSLEKVKTLDSLRLSRRQRQES
jgi:serine/threonine protein kinase